MHAVEQTRAAWDNSDVEQPKAHDTVESFEQFCRHHRESIETVTLEARLERWRLAKSDFADALYRSCARYFSTAGDFSTTAVEAYLKSLHVEDLALACACHKGIESAWDFFVHHYRGVIEASARALVRDRTRAEELAASLYGELFGMDRRNEKRRSPLEAYGGRSSLAAWLRVVIAKRQIDDWRATRRAESFDNHGASAPVPHAYDSPDPEVRRYLGLLAKSMNEAIAALDPKDKLRLSFYYLHGMTLAQIGALTGDHESTVSRKLDRTRRQLRALAERALRSDHNLNDEQVRLCFEHATDDWPFDLGHALGQER